jgi:hypothetical protein
MVKTFRKIGFATFKADDTRYLEHRLTVHVNAFQLALIAISMCVSMPRKLFVLTSGSQSQARTQRDVERI